MASRSIDDLLPQVREKAVLWIKMCEEAGHVQGTDWLITCTYRSQEEQDELYKQGRTKPGRKVTWTHHSRHTQRDAIDFGILKSGKYMGDIKVDVDGDEIPDYEELGQIAKECGFTWGGDWENNKDFPHIQDEVA